MCVYMYTQVCISIPFTLFLLFFGQIGWLSFSSAKGGIFIYLFIFLIKPFGFPGQLQTLCKGHRLGLFIHAVV